MCSSGLTNWLLLKVGHVRVPLLSGVRHHIDEGLSIAIVIYEANCLKQNMWPPRVTRCKVDLCKFDVNRKGRGPVLLTRLFGTYNCVVLHLR